VTAPGRPPPVDRQLLRRVPALRRHLGVAALASAGVAAAVILQANALASAIAAMMGYGAAHPLPALLAALGVVVVVRAVAATAVELSASRTMEAIRATLRRALLAHAVRDAEPAAAGLAAQRAKTATTGLDEMEPYVRSYLPALAAAFVVPVAAWVRIAGADVVSAVIVAVTVPLIPVFMILIGTVTAQRTQRRWATLQRLSGHFLDVLQGIPTLRLFGRVTPATDAVHEVSDRYRTVTMATLRVAFLSAFALELIATLSVAIVAVSVGLRLASGDLDLDTGLVVLLLAPECYLPLRRVGAAFHASQVGSDASAEVTELLERPTLPSGTLAPPEGHVTLRGVQVVRDERGTTTDPVELDLAPGAMAAVVGRSGSGKTTLLDVVRGRLAPTAGTVYVGRAPLPDLDPDGWADRIAVIRQRPVPVAATVREEMPDADDALVTATLERLGLAPYAAAAADHLSGGQLRRVEVARAVVAVRAGRASIVVADEPTAHLDEAAAGVVRDLLAELAAVDGAAVLVATHDPALAARAATVVDLSGDRDDQVTEPVELPDDTVARPVGPAAHRPVVGREVPPGAAIRRVLAGARGMGRRLAAAVGLGTLAEVSSVGLAGVAAWLVLRASQRPDLAALTVAVTAVRTFGIGKGFFRYAERIATHDVALRIVTRLRASVVARIGQIAPGGVAGWGRGDVARRVVEDVDQLVDLFARLLVPAASILLTGLGAALVALFIDPAAGAVLAGGVVIMGVVAPLLAARSEVNAARALAVARGAVGSSVLGFCEHVDALVAHRLVAHEQDRIAVAAAEVDRLERRRGRLRAGWAAASAMAPVATAALAAAVAAPPSPAVIGPALGLLIIWPLNVIELASQLVDAASGAPHVTTAASRTAAILDVAPPPSRTSAPLPSGVVPVALDDTAARWPGQDADVFAGVTFDLTPGSRLTLTGPSGAGKSTVAAVLVAFLDPTHGVYRIAEVDTASVAGDDVRTRVTWIEQTPWLADSTIRQNLLIASPDAGDDRLLEVLDVVGLGDWVAASRDGLDTRVGKGGAAVSGGEAQRIGLARALLSGHGVVVLDEPGAFLDAATAAAVLPRTLQELEGRSVLTISHRPFAGTGPSVRLAGPDGA
jgi:ATP-binding cassette subfamily C protein CydCD